MCDEDSDGFFSTFLVGVWDLWVVFVCFFDRWWWCGLRYALSDMLRDELCVESIDLETFLSEGELDG